MKYVKKESKHNKTIVNFIRIFTRFSRIDVTNGNKEEQQIIYLHVLLLMKHKTTEKSKKSEIQ